MPSDRALQLAEKAKRLTKRLAEQLSDTQAFTEQADDSWLTVLTAACAAIDALAALSQGAPSSCAVAPPAKVRRYDVLYEFAAENRISYNKLCTAVAAAISTQPARDCDSTPQASSNSGAEGQQAAPEQCPQVSDGVRCTFMRRPGERLCPDCNPQAARSEAPVGLVMADGTTPLLDYLADACSEDTPMDDWTRGYEECKRRLHKILAPQIAMLSASPPSAQPAETLLESHLNYTHQVLGGQPAEKDA
jgi:hypothetical protein